MIGAVKRCFAIGGALPTLQGRSLTELIELRDALGQYASEVLHSLPMDLLQELSQFMIELSIEIESKVA